MTHNRVVVDASLATMWAVAEDHSLHALALAGEWAASDTHLIAPCLLLTEVTNALFKRVKRREMDLPTATEALEVVLSFNIRIEEEAGLHIPAMELAHQLNQPATYDCHYLALALIADCDLWTGDRKFHAAATKLFPCVHWIGDFRTQ